jgi:hypothetical protein
MNTKQRVNGPKRRGQTVKAQSDAGLSEVARATSRLWRKHHLSYDQTKYVVERARRAAEVDRRVPGNSALSIEPEHKKDPIWAMKAEMANQGYRNGYDQAMEKSHQLLDRMQKRQCRARAAPRRGSAKHPS